MGRTVHLHAIDLDAADLDPGRIEAILEPDERARAARFRFARDRRRYVTRHAVLRTLLAAPCRVAPETLRFVTNAYGKPALDDGPGFSMSHSHGLALIAIAADGEVGCDVERCDPSFAEENIAQQFFSAGEIATLRSLPDEIQTAAFFDCWTRKEAYVKARGLGLSLPLDSFEVTVDPRQTAALLGGCDGWSLQSFEPAPLFHAAVVAPGTWDMVVHPRLHLRELLYDFAAV